MMTRASGLPDDAMRIAEKELSRLEQTSNQSAEYGMLKNYIETLIDLPWSKESIDATMEISLAREVS